MIKIDLLRAFVTVTRHGNLKDAAEELGRTQSAVSMALAQVEDVLGGPLFETDRKRDLTPLGAYLQTNAVELLRENDRIQELIFDYALGNAGHLRIAAVPSVAALVLPSVLRDFMARHPKARVDLTDSDSNSVRALVERGEADLGIAGPARTGQMLETTALFRDQLHVVFQQCKPIASDVRRMTWQHLDGRTLIANETLSDIEDPTVRKLLGESALSARNVASLLAMIQAGLGFTVLPGLATRNLDPALVAVPMSGPNCHRDISILARPNRTQSPLAGVFRTFLSQQMPDLIKILNLIPK